MESKARVERERRARADKAAFARLESQRVEREAARLAGELHAQKLLVDAQYFAERFGDKSVETRIAKERMRDPGDPPPEIVQQARTRVQNESFKKFAVGYMEV